MTDEARIESVGDRCLMVSFGDRVDPRINQRVHAFARRLIEANLPGVTDVVPAFTTVGVHYQPWRLDAAPGAQPPHEVLTRTLRGLLSVPDDASSSAPRTVEIPVCYDEDLGPDLSEVARACGLGVDEVIRRHAASDHVVYMLGFAPGFPYLGGLDPTLSRPRRATPRVKIPPGTVAIAREQSAIYTLETPGGWNLIGATPLALFDAAAQPPALLAPGDHVRFVPIGRAAYDAARREARR